MVKVTHAFKGKKIEKDAVSDNFLLSNNKGGYLSLPSEPWSKHQGLVFYDGLEHFKVIDSIVVNKEIKRFVNNFTNVRREYSDLKEQIFFPSGHDALLVDFDRRAELSLILDCRKVNDMRQFGRYYYIYEEAGNIVVEFTKRTDSSEDSSDNAEEFRIFLIVNTDGDTEKIEKWFEQTYSYDERNPGAKDSRYVFHAVDIGCTHLTCTFATSKSAALDEMKLVLKERDSLLKLEAGHDLLAKHLPRFPSENDFAKLAAMNSALSFRQDATYKGLYAGFPWFHQFWSRDELVSLKAFMDIGDYSFVKQVIFRYLEQIRDDGRLPNRFPHADLGSADSIGWLFKRIDDYLNALEKSRCLPRFLSFDELVRIKNRAEQVAYRILHCHSDDSLIINKGNETWMDTTVQAGNPRDGARLEVQALQLCIYRVMRRLCKITDDKMGMKLAEGFEKELKSAVRKSFWNGSYLKDGVDDDTIRPNIFIMYYICPDLLTKKEWNNCFDHILPKLWLDWGGLATIDKNSGRFCEETGGTTSSSYHDGDSWFWINNLAALCLKKHSWIRYRKYIDAIKKASVEEILWKGMLGHHSEISSADHLSSHGCFAQAWSAAMLLELL